MKNLSLLLASLLLVGNVANAQVTKNSSKAAILAENQKLKAEIEALRGKLSTTTSQVETKTTEVETVKAELAETQKKVPVIEPGHERDNKWVNFNMISGNNMHGFGSTKDDFYGEIEIGGRKGVFDFYGYMDFLDALHNKDSDLHAPDGTKSNFFTELQPRVSIDGMLGKDLSIGPVKEWYIAGYLKAGDGDSENGGLWTNGIGLGSDIEVPWLGKVGLNVYALYVEEDFKSSREGEWNGYLAKTNWFKPLYFFENGTFIAYQGYMNYMWDAGYDSKKDGSGRSQDEFQMFNGLAFHHKDFALQYGLKFVKDMCNVDNRNGNDSTGFEHYFIASYKF